jgi:hypothetical protein
MSGLASFSSAGALSMTNHQYRLERQNTFSLLDTVTLAARPKPIHVTAQWDGQLGNHRSICNLVSGSR